MRAHRQAFPTPRGATGGCPPDTVCGGRPRDPRGATGVSPRQRMRGRPAKGDQYGFGIRCQRPLTKARIARVDAMYGVREFDDDISGMRFEIRRKF